MMQNKTGKPKVHAGMYLRLVAYMRIKTRILMSAALQGGMYQNPGFLFQLRKSILPLQSRTCLTSLPAAPSPSSR